MRSYFYIEIKGTQEINRAPLQMSADMPIMHKGQGIVIDGETYTILNLLHHTSMTEVYVKKASIEFILS